MKKWILCILVLVLILPLTALAEETLPSAGDVIAGFRVNALDRIDYLDTDVVYMEHEKSGAQLIYLANDDLERSFSIGFRTNAETDQGLAHVFEHSTLSGSVKYPDPNLLFNMMSQTYNTYLNALTYPTATVYPCASLSEDQLYRFVDYYMAGVTEPLILTDERAMMREAYRYSLSSAEEEIAVNGVVYNEMKGSLSTPSSMMYTNLQKLLYPGSVRANVSGGIPSEILTMSWEALKDFHEKYYHPSNALITLYGDLDVERFLRLLDEEYLCKYDRREIVIDDPHYQPYEGHREKISEFPAAAGTSDENASFLCYGIAMNGCSAEETVLADVAAAAMNLESSALKQLAEEKLPGVYVGATVIPYTPVPTMVFVAMYANPEDQQAFEEIVNESIASLAETGISDSVYEMLVNSIKAQQLMSGEGNNIGVSLAQSFTFSWSYEGKVDAALSELDVTLSIGDYAENGSIDAIVRKYLTHPGQTAMSVTKPVPGLLEEEEAAFAQSLAAMKESMTEEELQALIEQTKAFDEWTKANDETSMIDEIKAVDVKTLPEETNSAVIMDETVDGVRWVASPVGEEGLVMPSFYFDASVIPADRLHDYALYSALLGVLDTENYTREELQEKVNIYFTSLSTNASTISFDDGSYQPVFAAGWGALSENLEKSYELMEEILFRTDFSDLEYIRSYLTQAAASTRQNYASGSPHSLAISIGRAAISDASLYAYRLGSLDFLTYLEEVVAMSDEALSELMKDMEEIRDLLMNRNALIVSCIGNEEVISQNMQRAQQMIDTLDDAQHEKVNYTAVLEPLPDSIAVVVDGSVQYNAMIAPMEEGTQTDGRYSAMSALTSDQLLLPYLRFENGAYSVMTGITEKYVYAVSYRDPNYELTYDYYGKLGDELRNLDLTQADIDGYITTAYSSMAMPVGPYTLASAAVSQAIRGELDETLDLMQQLKTFCPEDVHDMAAIYDRLAENGVKVTVGSQSVIEQNAEDFDMIIKVLLNEQKEEALPAA